MNPSVILTIITSAISIWAFQNRNVMNKLILSPYAVVHNKQWYRVISHAFIHANWTHLLFNMIALWSFGSVVVQYFRLLVNVPDAMRYLVGVQDIPFYVMYFVAIIIAAIPDLIKRKNDPTYFSLGASGGVSAIIFAALFFDPWSTVLIFFIPCPGIIFGVLYLIYSSYMSKRGGDNINHDAHFYGAIFGFIFPLLLNPASINIFIEKLSHPHFF